jgi:serine/threonine protein kinase
MMQGGKSVPMSVQPIELILISRNVALKILAAEALATSKEVEILERLKASGGPEQHVVELLDAFDHPSANGLHRVLVMEPVLKFDLRLSSDYSPKVGREAIRQMIAGVAFIHSCGVVHGGTFVVVPLS